MSSLFEGKCETCMDCPQEIEISIVPRTVDLGGFKVHRALPYSDRQMVGPFIFWDQMGPGEFAAGKGVDVRPHPHIGLSTVTYLFEGSLEHKDSLANDIRIVPGDLNLMTAGRGIVHSERTGDDIRQSSSKLAGIQSWLAQPREEEQGSPAFTHYPADSLPFIEGGDISGRIILGSLEGIRSPVKTQWETMYADLQIPYFGDRSCSRLLTKDYIGEIYCSITQPTGYRLCKSHSPLSRSSPASMSRKQSIMQPLENRFDARFLLEIIFSYAAPTVILPA